MAASGRNVAFCGDKSGHKLQLFLNFSTLQVEMEKIVGDIEIKIRHILKRKTIIFLFLD